MKTHSIVASSLSACPRRGQHGHCRRPVGVEGEKKWTLDAASSTTTLRGKVVHLGYCSAVPDIRTHNTK